MRVSPTRWRRKPAGIDMEQNYVTVTLCIAYPTGTILPFRDCLIWSSLRTTSLCSASFLGCRHVTARICYVLRRRCCQAPVPAAVDRYLLPTRRSAANPPHTVAAVDRQERRTDGRTLDRFIDSALHTIRVVSITDYRCRTQTWVFITFFRQSHQAFNCLSIYAYCAHPCSFPGRFRTAEVTLKTTQGHSHGCHLMGGLLNDFLSLRCNYQSINQSIYLSTLLVHNIRGNVQVTYI